MAQLIHEVAEFTLTCLLALGIILLGCIFIAAAITGSIELWEYLV
jgi:hypothetical protein